uniref:NrfD/PsrC family molybdoenzyme membrane anchor subunit n=1 Tax=Salmonella enterica TaxID=28901 RepID=UPI00398C76C8
SDWCVLVIPLDAPWVWRESYRRGLFVIGLGLGDDGRRSALAAALGGGFCSWWVLLGVVGLGLIIPLLLKPWANRSVTFHGVLAVRGASWTGFLLLPFFILYPV